MRLEEQMYIISALRPGYVLTAEEPLFLGATGFRFRHGAVEVAVAGPPSAGLLGARQCSIW